MRKLRWMGTTLILLAAFSMSGGCGGKTDKTGKDADKTDKTDKADKADKGSKGKEGHSHGAGPKGGAMAHWGGSKYHVEFKVDHDEQEATVYVYGSDEKTPAPIKAKDGEITLSIKEPAFKVQLKASPMKGETDGASSRFVGKHKNLGIVREFEGTITGVVDGTPYTGDFKEEPEEPKKK